VVAQGFHVLVEAVETSGDIALVSIKEGFQGFVGGEVALGEGRFGGEEAHRGRAGEGSAVPTKAVPRNLRREKTASDVFRTLLIGSPPHVVSRRSNHTPRFITFLQKIGPATRMRVNLTYSG
jgi:hypothetical protein